MKGNSTVSFGIQFMALCEGLYELGTVVLYDRVAGKNHKIKDPFLIYVIESDHKLD